MKCAKCGGDIRADQSFCPECGTAVPKDVETDGSSSFCGECGWKLTASDAVCPRCGTKNLQFQPTEPKRTETVLNEQPEQLKSEPQRKEIEHAEERTEEEKKEKTEQRTGSMFCPNCGLAITDSDAVCSRCGAKNLKYKAAEKQSKQLFCSQCGAAMAVTDAVCPTCGAANPKYKSVKPPEAPQVMFCPSCGASITTADTVCPNCMAPNPKAKKSKAPKNMFCPSCGASMTTADEVCPGCGVNNKKFKKKAKVNTNVLKWAIPSVAAVVVIGIVLLVVLNNDSVRINRANKLIEAGNFSEAATILENVVKDKTSEDKNYSEANYALATAELAMGQNYEAYKLFRMLSGYQDADQLAESCIYPQPSSGIVYQNSLYMDTTTQLTINAYGISQDVYIKLYSESGDYALSVYVRANSTYTIKFSYGTYTLKEAFGSDWFGEDDMFGDDGTYKKMTFNSGAADSFSFQYNNSYTLTLRSSYGGNVGSEAQSKDDF